MTEQQVIQQSDVMKALRMLSTGDFAGAESVLIKLPQNPDTVNLLSASLYEQGKLSEARQHLEDALKTFPDEPEIIFSLGVVAEKSGNFSDAAEHYKKASKLKEDFRYFYNLSVMEYTLNRFSESEKSLEKTIELNPNLPQAYINLSLLNIHRKNRQKAEEYSRKAILTDPSNVAAHYNMANIYELSGENLKALECYKKLLEIDPRHKKALGGLIGCYQKLCYWDELEKTDPNKATFFPFTSLFLFDDAEINFKVAKEKCHEIEQKAELIGKKFDLSARRKEKEKIVIGYLSADMRSHTVGYLTQHIFATHNRDRFTINCYSTGTNDNSECRKKIMESANNFVDCKNMSDLEAANKIYEDGVDILMEMNGHTHGGRLLISALRPAPIQVNLWGFVGSIGGDFMDYIIADKIVMPEEHQQYFSEKFVYLPDTLQINHSMEKISNEALTRSDLGLPEDVFIFNAHHQAFKIDKKMFKVWMNILKKIDKSVILLRQADPSAKQNLQKHADEFGVDRNRLIFLDKLPSREQYFKRLSLTDLSLDTRIYNGGSTTMDSLWAGVPVVVLLGNHYASRMAAGIINGIEMYDDLVVNSLEEYEDLVIELATNPEKLKSLKEKLWEKRKTATLFNNEECVRKLEKAYELMWKNYLEGNDPKTLEVK